MDIVETRRKNLRRWLEANGTPKKEKSLFTQLKGDLSFGEKLARRLEAQYKMGEHYLDTPGADTQPPPVAPERTAISGSLSLTVETAAEMRLLSVYRMANKDGRDAIDAAVELIRARLAADWAINQS
jgi:hypothetical protein